VNAFLYGQRLHLPSSGTSTINIKSIYTSVCVEWDVKPELKFSNISATYGQNSVLEMLKCFSFWGTLSPDPLPGLCPEPIVT